VSIAWFCHALDTPAGHDIVREFQSAAAEVQFPATIRVTWASPGTFEDVTLNQVRVWSQENPGGHVLYTHTKGASNQWESQFYWRSVMLDRLLRAWPARVADLVNYDTSGVWWFTPETMPEHVVSPYYAGNFWWARASYLATLPELPRLTEDARYEAEAWVGRGEPRARWMSQEWPVFSVPQ
jgi:hypothetical protein